jgi:hypothetical protein
MHLLALLAPPARYGEHPFKNPSFLLFSFSGLRACSFSSSRLYLPPLRGLSSCILFVSSPTFVKWNRCSPCPGQLFRLSRALIFPGRQSTPCDTHISTVHKGVVRIGTPGKLLVLFRRLCPEGVDLSGHRQRHARLRDVLWTKVVGVDALRAFDITFRLFACGMEVE